MLATRCRGPEDIVTDEVGVLVPVDDSRALADRIAHVLDHREEYPPQALRVHAVSNFGGWSS